MFEDEARNSEYSGLHVAIIMDGNGRWAMARGLPRSEGHRAGIQAIRRVVEAAPDLGIGTLTLFAFSADNWKRPASEVAALMQNFYDYLEADTPTVAEQNVRLRVIGRRDRLSPGLILAIETAEAATAGGRTFDLRIAWDYSGREAILRAARRLGRAADGSIEEFARLLAQGNPAPDVDLLIRSGGEQRLSDFLLWELAYAELVFVKRLWPDFDAGDLEAAVQEFWRRDRRFGRGVEQPLLVASSELLVKKVSR